MFTKTINHLQCGDCSKNRLDIKSDTLALTLMVSAWELHYNSGVVGIFSLSLKPTEAHVHSHNDVIRKALSLHVELLLLSAITIIPDPRISQRFI